MDTYVVDKERALRLWTRFRISYYVNTIIIVGLWTILFSQPAGGISGGFSALMLAVVICSHLNYHYQLATVANAIGKSSNWWFASFITFPFAPLLSYHFIKPAAVRSGIPLP
jgi:hypothetical protein